MLIDMHAHGSEISRCCKISLDEGLKVAQENGMDGLVLANHYQKNYVTDGDYLGFAKRYMAECDRAVEYGRAQGIPVFWAIEVTMEQYSAVHMLLYGVDHDFLLRHPTVFDYSQEQLYRAVQECGGVLVQAHPFRSGGAVLDTKLMDGVEVNCHPKYDYTYCKELMDIAQRDGLIVTCGGDYHKDTHRVRCGLYLPDSIGDSRALGVYLQQANEWKLCVTEVKTRTAEDVLFSRKV